MVDRNSAEPCALREPIRKGILSAQYLKGVTDPQWKNESGFED
jgi:hypothetical protein